MAVPIFKPYRILDDPQTTFADTGLTPNAVESLYVGRMRYRGGDVEDVALIGITTDDADQLFYAVEDAGTAGHMPTVWASLKRIDADSETVLVQAASWDVNQ